MKQFVLLVITVVIMSLSVKALSFLMDVPTNEVYGPFLVGVVSAMIVQMSTKEER